MATAANQKQNAHNASAQRQTWKDNVSSVEQCLQLFRDGGHSEYGGEPVTQLEHALQCATLAEEADSSSALIAASLLHDIGHLLHNLPDDAPDHGIDDAHENLGHNFLQKCFGPDVCDPVRLHVPAKRYLCAIDSSYLNGLSHPSIVSLKLQGGPMHPSEIEVFEQNPYFGNAVLLRKWDDMAKVSGLETPPLEHFAKHLVSASQNNR